MAAPNFPVAAPPPKWAVIIWCALILSLIAGGFWVRDYSAKKEAALATLIFEARSPASANALAKCLSSSEIGGFGIGKRRGRSAFDEDADTNTLHVVNAARHLTIEIEDGSERTVRIIARKGRELRASERALLDRCLALPPG